VADDHVATRGDGGAAGAPDGAVDDLAHQAWRAAQRHRRGEAALLLPDGSATVQWLPVPRPGRQHLGAGAEEHVLPGEGPAERAGAARRA
jgi:hypothetical protein